MMQLLRACGLRDEQVAQLAQRVFEALDRFMAVWIGRSFRGRTSDHPYQKAGRLQTSVEILCTHFVEHQVEGFHDLLLGDELNLRRVLKSLVVPRKCDKEERKELKLLVKQTWNDIKALRARCLELMQERMDAEGE